MILELNNINYKYGDHIIVNNANMSINNGDRIGLVGGNGCGKTTLLKLIVGQLDIQSGTIIKGSGVNIGYLAQESTIDSNNTVYDELLTVFSYQQSLLISQEEMSILLSQLDHDSDEYHKQSHKYARILSEIDRTDAYNTKVRIDSVLNGMGIMILRDSVINVLSGGERTKVELAKLLLTEPQLLILDEPTNHLDLGTIEWLQQFLANYKSTILIVSHDRQFLDKITTGIVEIFARTTYQYKGNYAKYIIARDARLALESKEYVKQQKVIAKLTDYIARNKVRASTANMAKSREKMLERMEVIEEPSEYVRNANFRFSCSDQPSEKALTVNNVSIAFDGRDILSNVTLAVARHDRIAIIGDNGSGKSTLLRHINNIGIGQPGSVILGKNVRMGYYDQQALTLDHTLNVLDQMWQDNTLMSQTEVRSLLAMVGLTGQEAFKSVASLSGGEKARLCLCMLMAKDNNVLLLDEPTNHLDLMSREKLEQALLDYNGTIVFVSHDRYFVNKLATKVVRVADCSIAEYVGNYDSYLLANRANDVQPTVTVAPKSNYRNNKQRSQDTQRKQRIASIEKQLQSLYTQQQQLSQEIQDNSSDYMLIADKCEQLEQLTATEEQLLVELEQLELS